MSARVKGVRMPSYHHGDLRRALLDQALVQADAVGLEHVSLRAIAAKSGVTHAAAYHHFANKDELLGALAREGFELLDDKLASVRARLPKRRFADLGLAYLGFAHEHPVHFRLMFRASVVSPVWNEELEAVTLAPWARVHEAVLAAGGTKDLTDLAWASMHGLATLSLDGPLAMRGDNVDEMSRRSIALLVRLLPRRIRHAAR